MAPIDVTDRRLAQPSESFPIPGLESSLEIANLALRFIVEMAAYAALGYWGASNRSPVIIRVTLATVTPLAAMVLWSLLLAPKARWRRRDPLAIGSELAVFAGAAGALGVAGPVWLSTTFFAVAVINTFLVRLLERRRSAAGGSSKPASKVAASTT
jgi:hypothetical protein